MFVNLPHFNGHLMVLELSERPHQNWSLMNVRSPTCSPWPRDKQLTATESVYWILKRSQNNYLVHDNEDKVDKMLRTHYWFPLEREPNEPLGSTESAYL